MPGYRKLAAVKSNEKVNLYRNICSLVTVPPKYNLGQLRPPLVTERCVHSPTNFNECRKLPKWGKYYTTTPGDLLFDNPYGQYATWAFLLQSKRLKKRNTRNKKIPVAKSGAVG